MFGTCAQESSTSAAILFNTVLHFMEYLAVLSVKTLVSASKKVGREGGTRSSTGALVTLPCELQGRIKQGCYRYCFKDLFDILQVNVLKSIEM